MDETRLNPCSSGIAPADEFAPAPANESASPHSTRPEDPPSPVGGDLAAGDEDVLGGRAEEAVHEEEPVSTDDYERISQRLSRANRGQRVQHNVSAFPIARSDAANVAHRSYERWFR